MMKEGQDQLRAKIKSYVQDLVVQGFLYAKDFAKVSKKLGIAHALSVKEKRNALSIVPKK